LVDRIVIASDSRARIVDALETSYRQAGEAIFESVPRDGEKTASAALLPSLRVQPLQDPLRRT